MQEAYALENERSAKPLAKGRDYHGRKATFTGLKPGDRVLVCILTPKDDTKKLRSFWEEKGVYRDWKERRQQPRA